LSTPSIGPRYGFPLLKIIISRNIYRMGTLIVIASLQRYCLLNNQGGVRREVTVHAIQQKFDFKLADIG
jgi:hypothetical protein